MTANPPPTLPPGFPPELSVLATEIHTYFRKLPRLLDGKFVVVKGNELFGVWDTQLDAIQHGQIKFEDGRFLAQEIHPRFLDAFGSFFGIPASGAA